MSARLLLVPFLIATLALPGLAQDRSARDEQEALVKRLLELIEETAREEAERSIDRTDHGGLDARDQAAAEEIVRKLDRTRVTVSFDGVSLDEALDFLRDTTGLNLVVTAKAREVAADKKVKLRLKDVKTRNVLEVLLGQVDESLRYAIRHEALQIGTTEDWKARAVVLDVIPIDDLLFSPPDFPAPEAGLDALSRGKKKR